MENEYIDLIKHMAKYDQLPNSYIGMDVLVYDFEKTKEVIGKLLNWWVNDNNLIYGEVEVKGKEPGSSWLISDIMIQFDKNNIN